MDYHLLTQTRVMLQSTISDESDLRNGNFQLHLRFHSTSTTLHIFSLPVLFSIPRMVEETSRIGDISMTTNDAQRVDIAEKCKGYLRAGRVHNSPAEFADGRGGGGW